MKHDWNADLLLTQHFDTPIRFYLHERRLDLIEIRTHIHNRVHGVDKEGKRHLLHKEDILFAFPVKQMPYVKPNVKVFGPVKNLRLNRKSALQNRFHIDNNKLESVVGDSIVIVTRRGHVIRGELQAFDQEHLFMRVDKKVVLVYRNGLFGFREGLDENLAQNQNLHELREKRKKWVEANRENNFEEGIKHLLTDLYPDDAHFIYELLQNAEDAGASEVRFALNEDNAIFEHNGARLFSLTDVEAITSIGFSTKKDDPTAIGKFGIGFKAVFAYTATPEIESGEFHFRIQDMVVPDTQELFPGTLGEGKTRFVFPFDNPKKPPEKARTEIQKNLQQLNENTLLFLSNIRKIEYRLPDSTMGFLERREMANDESRIEIYVTRPGNQKPESNQYLRFIKDVDAQDEGGQSKHCRIAVAFGMDKSEGSGWKIIPVNPGQVSIYFPAVKEASKLRFHMHAPFASTVARDSVRDCPANDGLRNHLADLIAESMHAIRDRGLLNVEFLATLPNNRDNLFPFYLPIQERLINEFNTEKLTPVKRNPSEYASASVCYRGSSALSNVIKDKDLAVLLGRGCSQPLWIANPRQINQPEDNFLSMLSISQWTTEDLIEVLDSDEKVIKWLKKKSDEWHQNLYELLGDFLLRAPSSPVYIARERKEKLSNLSIVRCSDGKYRISSECYFPGDDMESEFQKKKTQAEEFHYVAKGVYSSGQNKNQQKKARNFLEEIGVRDVDESERIKAILRQRYEDPDIRISPNVHEKDMKRFIAFVESNSDNVALFKGYNIFNTSGGNWFTSLIFLDSPYLETGLSVYYEDDNYLEFIDEENIDPYFSLDYEQSTIDPERLGKFARVLGARTQLEATEQIIPESHPEWSNRLKQGSGHWRNNTGIDEDYRIPEFQLLLANPSITKSKLFWQTMCSLPESCLKARFRWNQSNPVNEGHSTLVHELRNSKWVPQKNGDTISFVRPCDALRNDLPGGFPYDTEQKWLKAIEFGKTAKQHKLENIFKQREQLVQNQHAAEFGFGSADEAKNAAKYFGMRGISVGESLKKLQVQERRKELLIIDLSDAEEKEYETRARSIRSTRSTIDPRTALRARYTTDENTVHCQMCSKRMPFKKRNSEDDYFEAVEALGKAYFFKEHEAQYLALCPECAAKYKEFVKKDRKAREVFYGVLKDSDNPQICLESNGETIYIRFEDKHWQDLKTVVYYYENVYNSDETD